MVIEWGERKFNVDYSKSDYVIRFKDHRIDEQISKFMYKSKEYKTMYGLYNYNTAKFYSPTRGIVYYSIADLVQFVASGEAVIAGITEIHDKT